MDIENLAICVCACAVLYMKARDTEMADVLNIYYFTVAQGLEKSTVSHEAGKTVGEPEGRE